jgi:hypothetical protein
MLLYSLWSTASQSSFGPSDVAVLIEVDSGLSSAMLTSSLGPSCTWLDVRRYLSSFASIGYLRKRLVLPSWTYGTHSPSFLKMWTQECEKSHQR